MSAQPNPAPVEKITRDQLRGASDKKAPPTTVKRIMLGSCSVTLKRWPSDGSHSIELGQKDDRANEWNNVSFGVHLAPSVLSAISALAAMGQKAEAEAQ